LKIAATRIPPARGPLLKRILRTRAFKILALMLVVFCVVSSVFAAHFYKEYGRIIDRRLNNQVFQNSAKIYGPSPIALTNLFDAARVKRRLVEFKDIPKVLVDAVTAGEDRGFFSHHGLAPLRIAGAFISNLHEGNRLQGGSTITQQLARNLFLTAAPAWRRKVAEAFMAVILEMRLTKEEIFALYSNEVYLGQIGSFAVHGFGEGSIAMFGKDLSELTLSEAATLAGVIPAPNAYSPGRHPARAKARRNLILEAMRTTAAITTEEYERAKLAPLVAIQGAGDSTEAPYLMDFIREELLRDYSEDELMNGGLNVYTTMDPALQKAAVDAVTRGLASVEAQLAARRKNKNSAGEAQPQAALIAIDPHTGAIKAMVGGTDYAASQYNRITHALRQPGSVFKPIVYAAALETAYDVGSNELDPASDSNALQNSRIITPLTMFLDAPGFFFSGGAVYAPSNYKQDYRGLVTVRTALEHSLNLATIRIAERIGFGRVASLARRMGLNARIKGYPAVAIGAFEVTPLELAGAYTAFANEGKRIEPHTLLRVASKEGLDLKVYTYPPRQVINRSIAYLMTHLMEGVIDHGTGAGVRSRGFRRPAAGKTGTSRDGWFAGYTPDLLVITWVGFDDNRDLGLEGARSALPIWTDFMLKAYELHPPTRERSMSFMVPPGVEIVCIDAETHTRATPLCPNTFDEAFIEGTAPSASPATLPLQITEHS